MMVIAYNMRPDELDMSNVHLKSKLGKEAGEFIARYSAGVRKEFESLQKPAEFLIGIEYKLVLAKNEKEGDIVLATGSAGGTHTQVIEVPKDPGASHPFRRKEVLEKINEDLPGVNINQFDIQCVNKVYRIRKRAEYFYQGRVKGSPAQYSQRFVDWLLQQYGQDSSFFLNARNKARQKSK